MVTARLSPSGPNIDVSGSGLPQVAENGDITQKSLTTTSGTLQIGQTVALTILDPAHKFDIDFQCVASAVVQPTAYGATVILTLQAQKNGGGWQNVNTAQYSVNNSMTFCTPYVAKTTDQALPLAGLAAGDLVEVRVMGQCTSDGSVAGGGVVISPSENTGRSNLRFVEYG